MVTKKEPWKSDNWFVSPKFVGHREPRILMGKKSGLDSVAI